MVSCRLGFKNLEVGPSDRPQAKEDWTLGLVGVSPRVDLNGDREGTHAAKRVNITPPQP